MKKSEFLKETACRTPAGLAQLAESAGASWDPEEPLPERLEFTEGTACVSPAATDGRPSRRLFVAYYPDGAAALKEAVLRYNLIPKLWRFADDNESLPFRCGECRAALRALLAQECV